MPKTSIYDYGDKIDRITSGQRAHVLLGNGFSIDCDPVFRYDSLYDAAVKAGLSERAKKVFERLGTSNFEGVLRLLDDTHWVASVYDLIDGPSSAIKDDAAIVRDALVKAVADSHLDHSGCVSDNAKSNALQFLQRYHNVFTTNYDLLTYWVNMHAPDKERWQDGFREDPDDPDAQYVVFSERLGHKRGLFFLHGALHICFDRGSLQKYCWSRTRTPLKQLIQTGLAENRFPHFIAEGTGEKKLHQIQRSGYLWYCLDKLARLENSLTIVGQSLGETDRHIRDAISNNLKLKRVFIGLHGNPDSDRNQATRDAASQMISHRSFLLQTHKGHELSVSFFDTESAHIWR